MKILATPGVIEYLWELSDILYEKGYFGYGESALKYVDDLIDEIVKTLPTRLSKPAPKYFDKYGKNMFYAFFRKNKHTTWYVFFTKYEQNGETIYLIRYITNNHTDAQHLP